ncbi:hypothetical protein TNCV_2122441 [Trichonephila clavipes]|nr:hypothetical protein TNCV_2122441 [Trichonephila clavipes]
MIKNPRSIDSYARNIPLDKSDHHCPEAVTGLFRYRYSTPPSLSRSIEAITGFFRYRYTNDFERGCIVGIRKAAPLQRTDTTVQRLWGHLEPPTNLNAGVDGVYVTPLDLEGQDAQMRGNIGGFFDRLQLFQRYHYLLFNVLQPLHYPSGTFHPFPALGSDAVLHSRRP